MIDYEKLAEAGHDSYFLGELKSEIERTLWRDVARGVVAALGEQGLVVTPREIMDAVDAWYDQIGYDMPERAKLFNAVKDHRFKQSVAPAAPDEREQGLMILAEDDVRELVLGYGGFKDKPAYLRARHMLPENQENP